VSLVSGRKRIYVDENEWNRLRREAGKLAEVQRDLPRLVQQVKDQTQRDIDRSMTEVEARQAEFGQAVTQLSERNRQLEQQTAQRLRANTDRLRTELSQQGDRLRTETADALREQRATLHRAIDQERQERERRLSEIDTAVQGILGDQAKAAALTQDYLADAEILREQILKFPHQRYLPDRLDSLDKRLVLARSNVEGGVAAFGLSGAQELCQSYGDLRLELEQLDQDWRACRIAAERDLVLLQGLLDQNTTLDLKGRFGADAPDTAPDVDHWSRGALSRLSVEVATLLAQVRDEEQALPTESLLRVVTTLAPEFEQRLESVVSQAVTAMQASQLRTNLAQLIADALDERHQYEVAEFGFADDDERQAYLAKTVHHVSGSEIVIQVEPGGAEDQPPTVRLHNFDADGASEDERDARTRSIRESVREHSGIDLTAQEEASRPDERMREITQTITATTRTAENTESGADGTRDRTARSS
jgi:hypothetical protein